MAILSHIKTTPRFEDRLNSIKKRIHEEGDKPYASVQKQLAILEELVSCDFGKFLIEYQGVNGFWTQYMCSYPIRKQNGEKVTKNQFEKKLLEQLPTLLATQERSQIFQEEIQKRFHEGVTFASLPCGLMYDLLNLNTSSAQIFQFVGIDLDEECLQQAKAISLVKGLFHHCLFLQTDAWNLKFENEFHLLCSNGLNIYQKDDDKVTQLYSNFYRALKKDGALIVSTITPSPEQSAESTWKMDKIKQEHLLLQKIIFVDLMQAGFQYARSVSQTQEQLKQAGFQSISTLSDSQGIFITFVAIK